MRTPFHHTRAAVSSWGEVHATLQLQKSGGESSAAAPALVRVLAWRSVVAMLDKH